MRSRSRGRRTVLNALGTIGIGAVAIGPGVAAGSRTDDRHGESPPVPPEAAEALARRPGTYPAAADRIVDGDHLVVLLEEDGRIVDQVVVPAEEHPSIEEGDRLVVTLEDGDPTEIRRVADPAES